MCSDGKLFELEYANEFFSIIRMCSNILDVFLIALAPNLANARDLIYYRWSYIG